MAEHQARKNVQKRMDTLSKKPTHAERIKQLEQQCEKLQKQIDQISQDKNDKLEVHQEWLVNLEHKVAQIRVTKDAIKEFAGICVNSATKALAITAGLQLTIIVVKYILQV